MLKKSEVFQDTDGHLHMSVVKKGFVKRYTIRNDGSLAVQSIYGPNQFFPLTLAYKMLLNQAVYTGPETIHYEAVTDAELYTLDNDAFKAGIDADVSLYRDLFFVSGRRTRSNIQRLENMSLAVYYNRVAHQLLYFAQTFGKEKGSEVIIQLPLTHQDIADVISSTRETVSLAMVELKKKKIIKSGAGKKIIVRDIQKLEEEAYS